jgi:hypothetical protein
MEKGRTGTLSWLRERLLTSHNARTALLPAPPTLKVLERCVQQYSAGCSELREIGGYHFDVPLEFAEKT